MFMNLTYLLFEKRSNLFILIVLTFWILSLFLAPLALQRNTIQDLNGSSTFVNHQTLWDELPSYPGIIYLVGDVLCHQKSHRSFLINDNQMPVCVRCFSVYLGFFIAIVFTLLISNDQRPNDYILFLFPSKIGEILKQKIDLEFLPLIVIGCFLAPVTIDGGFQLFTGYESTHFLRMLTGFPAGLIGGILLGALVNT